MSKKTSVIDKAHTEVNKMSSQQIIFGIHAVTSTLENNPERIIQILCLKERRDKKIETLITLAESFDLPIKFVSHDELDRITSGKHQGIVAYCKEQIIYHENDLTSLIQSTNSPFILVLDGVQDPHNLGACFRSADAAGVTAIIAPKDRAVGITAVVAKVASGATETVPFVQVTNLVRTLELLKSHGLWIYGAASEAEKTLYESKLRGPIVIVLGAEGTGLRRLTREHCDVLLKIPMKGTVSSLNVSVAAGIFLFEVVRQRSV